MPRSILCSMCPAASAQQNAIAPALLLPSALAWSVCRSIRGQKGLCSYLMGRQPCGDVQVQALAVDLHLGHLLALLFCVRLLTLVTSPVIAVPVDGMSP